MNAPTACVVVINANSVFVSRSGDAAKLILLASDLVEIVCREKLPRSLLTMTGMTKEPKGTVTAGQEEVTTGLRDALTVYVGCKRERAIRYDAIQSEVL